jgi:hypothetical protein
MRRRSSATFIRSSTVRGLHEKAVDLPACVQERLETHVMKAPSPRRGIEGATMADDNKDRVLRSFSSLNEAAIEHLQGKYGQDVQVQSTKAVLSQILSHIDRRTVVDIGAVAAYDRGFDRTSPGYDKYYDRDRASSIEDLVTNPQVSKLVRGE